MAALNAITNDALLYIVVWGEGTLQSPEVGETAWVLANVAGVDQSVIDANGPPHTKVVASVATVMTAPEKDAVDAAALAIAQAAAMQELVTTLDGNSAKLYAGVGGGAVVLSCADLDLEIDLTGNLGPGEVTFTDLPAAGMVRQITIDVIQDGTGSHTIASDAWTGVDWGGAGAPVFGNAADTSKLITIYCKGTALRGFCSSIFGS